MARNTDRDALFTVSIPKDSELLQLLRDDAEQTHLSVAKLIVVRLKDWYLPTGQASVRRTPSEPPDIEEIALKSITEKLPEIEEPTPFIASQEEPPMLDENTQDALSAWF